MNEITFSKKYGAFNCLVT